MMKKIVPIILAGGTGSRLWPLSRESFPKQFIQLIHEDKFTLLQRTYKRLEGLKNFQNPIIICNEEHRFIVADQMKRINVKPLAILLEPSRRNTAPAITIAALKAIEFFKKTGDDPILLILSSDHQIEDINSFQESILNSIPLAEDGNLVIFGVTPTYPATGYGYIKSKDTLLDKNSSARRVDKFIEKPNEQKANNLFGNKKYSWNSGMFVFKASAILNEISNFERDIAINCKECLGNSKEDLDFLRLDKKSFSKCPDISIDFAVFEKTLKGVVVPLNCGWDDIGSWESLWEISEKDEFQNTISGKVLVEDTKNSLIRSEEKLIVTLGLENLIIIDTKDALLIANKENSQNIKNLVSTLDKKGFKESKEHKKIFRPWGYYLSIDEGVNWQIKKIEVNPGASLSLQIHHHRSEHWIVVQGTAGVQINDEKKILSENESAYIPIGAKHRLSNSGKIPLIIIEVQSGNYLGEDDIVRLDDNYGRS